MFLKFWLPVKLRSSEIATERLLSGLEYTQALRRKSLALDCPALYGTPRAKIGMDVVAGKWTLPTGARISGTNNAAPWRASGGGDSRPTVQGKSPSQESEA